MARAADTGWPSAMVTGAAVGLMPATRLNPAVGPDDRRRAGQPRPPLIPRPLYSRSAIAVESNSPVGSWRDAIIVEIHDAVGLRPHTDFSRHRSRQGVIEIELAVQIALDLRSADPDFEILPLPARGRRVADPLDARSLAFLVFEQHQIVFERIGPHQKVVAVRLEIEQDPGALIDASGNRLEPEADLPAPEIVDPLRDGIGEVGVGLHIIEKLGVALAIDGPRLVRQVGGGLTLLPTPAVDDEELVVALRTNRPEPDDREKALGFGTDRLVREVKLHAAIRRPRRLRLR